MTFRSRAFMLEAATGQLSAHYSDTEANARALRRRFASVTARAERHNRWQCRLKTATSVVALVALITLPVAVVMISEGWSLELTLRHFAAGQNCESARAVGQAPARRGEPGYWPKLDADDDGIACEAGPPRRISATPN